MDREYTLFDEDAVRDLDAEYHDRRADQDPRWWALFLIPIAFIAGWTIHEAVDRVPDTSIITRQEYGIGGAPFDATQLTPLPTAMILEPTSTPTPTPTPEDNEQGSVEDLLSPVVTRGTTR